jgi:hemerythrin
MEVLKWSDSYSVGHAEIDQQHQKLFSLFSRLVEGMSVDTRPRHLEQGFVQLCGYVKNHFRFEEQVMKKAGYPDLDKHKKKHAKIKEQLKGFRKKYNKASGKKKDIIASEVAQFLLEWLQGHIKREDQKYVPYVSQPATKPASAVDQDYSDAGVTSSAFVWSDSYSVGNQKIDDQHKRLFAIFDGLNQAINSGDPIFGVEKAFLQMRGYVKNHFRFEESLMKKNRYPGFKQHKAKHEGICNSLKAYRLRFNTDNTQEKEKIALEVSKFFENWLKSHIKSEDQQYVPYVGG